MNRSTVLVLLIFFSLNSYSQTTSISGTVLDHQTGEPLVGAKVKLLSTDVEKITDFDGNFSFSDAKEGVNEISISYISYEDAKLNRVLIKLGEAASLTIKMKRATSNSNQNILASSSSENSQS